MGDLYPAFLDLEGREALVAGGGAVALRKVAALRRAGARVTVVSPVVCGGLAAFAEKRKIGLRRRSYRASDLRNQWLVIAATDRADVDRKISLDAAAARVFCNVVDQPELCSFQVPAVARRGRLRIAVSTSGASPALARTIRRRLEQEYGPPYAELLNALLVLRRHFRRKYPNDGARRRRLLEAFLKSPAPALLLKRGDSEAFGRELRRWKSL